MTAGIIVVIHFFVCFFVLLLFVYSFICPSILQVKVHSDDEDSDSDAEMDTDPLQVSSSECLQL